MSVKDCGHHEDERRKYLRRFFAGLLIVIFIILLVILIIWAALRPSKPKFTLQDATVYSFNLSTPNILTSVFQVTIQSKNPNGHIGVYYDKLKIYAVYHDQQITYPTDIPPTYQDTNGLNIWSPFISGYNIPIAPYIGNQLNSERSMGDVMLSVKMDGNVKWKVGAFVSGVYKLHVKCEALIPFGNQDSGTVVGKNNAMKYQLVQSCSVSV